MGKLWLFCGVLALTIGACGGGGGGSSAPATGGNNNPGGTSAFDNTIGLPACPAGNALFSVPPISLDLLQYWQPLGHMSPPAHVFPADHQYLTLFAANAGSAWPLLAPGNIRVYQVKASTTGGITDYGVYFQPCGDVRARFGHVTSLSAALLAAAGPLDQNCSTYLPAPNAPTTGCDSRQFKFELKAGEAMGTAKGLDFWLQDRRIAPLHFTNPARFVADSGYDTFHTVGASDYFTPAVAAQIAPKVGGIDPRTYSGSVFRTVAPQGGSIAVDVDGSAMGYWFNPAQAYPPESYHAALVPESLLPTSTQVFSIGLSQPNHGSEAIIGTFTPTTSGSVNRAFDTVTANGNIYCYQTSWHTGAVFLLQLSSASALRLEYREGPTSCAAQSPYAFTGAAFTYVR
ncbi:MAG: hypothetical protein V4582_25090 [Pseudomonadota bacterium]